MLMSFEVPKVEEVCTECVFGDWIGHETSFLVENPVMGNHRTIDDLEWRGLTFFKHALPNEGFELLT